MSATDVLLVAAVLLGMSVQSAIGFGFAFFVAPAAFLAFEPVEAVTLVILLAIAINLLVLFGEGRDREVATGSIRLIVLAALPGIVAGALLVTRVEREPLQLLVGVVILIGAAIQGFGLRDRGAAARPRRRPAIEAGGGFAGGVLTSSVSVNGPALVFTLTALGLRGAGLRDSLAATLLSLSVAALVIVLIVAGVEEALPHGLVLLAIIPAIPLGHRFGAAVFRRFDDATHHRAALVACFGAGVLSIIAALA